MSIDHGKPQIDKLREDRDELEARIEELKCKRRVWRDARNRLPSYCWTAHDNLGSAIDGAGDEIGRLEHEIDILNEDIPMERPDRL